ncbi:MAG: hypothetical protein AAF985_24395, partial [Bacteroidota bacterium]
ALRTERMNIPDSLDGAAFQNESGAYLYVLWAITSTDQSEAASGVYSFPAILGIDQVEQYEWDYAQTGAVEIRNSNNIPLSGAPVFFKKSLQSLPVEWLSFVAHRRLADVVLEWVTEWEQDNDYFEIEHAPGNQSFNTIGRIEGAGTSVAAQYYQFVHHRAVRGLNYYRLKQVDFDGHISYSPIIAIDIEVKDLFLLRPSPAVDEVHLEFYDFYDRDIEVGVYDLVGRQRIFTSLPSGRNALSIPIDQLEAGAYFIRMKVLGVDFFTQRFIKIEL